MTDAELDRQLGVLIALFDQSRIACGGDLEMESHWAKYLCVLTAGFLENSLKSVYSRLCRRDASEPVAAFATITLDRIRNPKTQRFLEVTNSFRTDWGESLKEFATAEGRGLAIDSIMNNRHLIAHGRSSEITLERARGYLIKAVEVVEFVESQATQ
jgi:hypothetical protein